MISRSGIGQKRLASTAFGREILIEGDAALIRIKIGAIKDISEDHSPQLGGDLDTNGKEIIHSLLTASYPVFTDASKKLVSKKIDPADIKTKALIALGDTDTTLTAAEVIDSGIFTITPSAPRALTTPTAVNIIAGITNQVGTWFDFTIINLAAFDVTLNSGAGVTLVGNTVANDDSITFKTLITSGTTVTIFKM